VLIPKPEGRGSLQFDAISLKVADGGLATVNHSGGAIDCPIKIRAGDFARGVPMCLISRDNFSLCTSMGKAMRLTNVVTTRIHTDATEYSY
jgi:hypothetical protein